ncbi:MAG TPA: glycoside hydrolase family 44 protein [Polyangiaceae bacterium]|nr:glycoside hydrolase family 44 protein [Polyangiaceae bacterium]
MKARVSIAVGLVLLVLGGLFVMSRGRRAHRAETPQELGPRKPQKLEVEQVIYDGALGQGWEDWGWGPHELGNGPAKVVFEGYGGILLHTKRLTQPFGALVFNLKAPPAWGDFIQVSLKGAGVAEADFPNVRVEARHVVPGKDGWAEVLIDWQELNPKRRPFDRVMIGAYGSVGRDWVLLDDIVLTRGTASANAAVPGEQQVALRVLCNRPGQPISELVYGGSTDDWNSGQSAKRIGGNPLSRSNWELGTWNTGHDWFFENTSQKVTMFEVVDGHAAAKQKLALVVPMLGWVAKDASSLGFPRALFGEQEKHDPYKNEAGNGVGRDGKPLAPRSPELTSVAAPPELIEKWIARLVARDKARGPRGVQVYILDNEPSLWNVTHRDVWPKPLGYDELLQRTINYATVIRNADPDGLIAGPAEWGWLGYQMSAVDRETPDKSQPDRKAHGDVALVPWYLRKLAEHERATRQRLLDVLDVHFYPAADGIFGGSAKTDSEASDLRVRSTRALWDPTYSDESWISESIRLIPRMKEWVRESYPGLKVMLGEWSFGADDHISGGVATAEALGRFGQHGLDSAFFWGPLKEGAPNYWAFRAFRNFDGKGARFQDVSVPVVEGEHVSLFASRDADATQIVMVLVNRSQTIDASANITLEGCAKPGPSRRFSYDASAKGLTAGQLQPTDQGVSLRLTPFSFTVVEVKLEKKP